jgi:hypothetical protein
LPTEISGGCNPASIDAIWRANPEVEKAGSCRGPKWLNARAMVISTPDAGRTGDEHSRPAARLAERVDQMMGPAHVDRQRRFRMLPRLPDVGRAGAVIHDRGPQSGDRLDDRRSIEDVDRLPRHGGTAGALAWRRSSAGPKPADNGFMTRGIRL